ncbi:hypothetical protein B6N13_13485 [Marinomonas sp. UCMA 3892]|uniref:hypothetical protein n=1 Tax=Marinomonas sp. UCMA 3892 TaxID=1972585 RepID=UPI00146C1789|nr:hypothetical protein [Marinomonas sp. UCMA 3892]NLU99090.1 hypothetical protein [Marinomonas sp. UCMA 3892]
MTDTKSIGAMSYFLSPEARLTIIIPVILYNIAFWSLGAGAALLLTACYSGFLELFSKQAQSLSIIALILISGCAHFLYLNGFTFFEIKQESVFLSVGGSITVIMVFSFYSLIGRPVVRTQAENALPSLKLSPFYGTAKYDRVWQEVSLAWILTYGLKGVLVVILSKDMPHYSDFAVFFGAWPLTLLLIIFSYYWPSFRWSSLKTETK